MKRIVLERLSLDNFKGISHWEFISPGGADVNIVGENGVGKTTLNDAYLWLLLGEDSNGSHVFKVQPLDKDGNLIKKIDTTVSATFCFDGDSHEFKKTMTQKWVTPRNTNQEYLKATECSYYIDNVPLKESVYKSEIAERFCDQDNLRLLSSVSAFNKLDMSVRRKKLMEMAGQIPDILTADRFPNLFSAYQKIKNIESVKSSTQISIKELEIKKAGIPDRITENERDLPSGIDFDSLRREESEIESEISKIDSKLQKTANDRANLFDNIKSKTDELMELENELIEIESGLSKDRSKKMEEISRELSHFQVKEEGLKGVYSVLVRDIQRSVEEKERLVNEKVELMGKWREKNKETFSFEGNSVCPTCKRPFSEDEMVEIREEAVRTFNSGKASVLKMISEQGSRVARRIAEIEEEIHQSEDKEKEIRESLSEIDSKRKSLEINLKEFPTIEHYKEFSKEYQNVLAKRNLARQEAMTYSSEPDDVQKLKERKVELQARLKDVVRQLSLEANIERVIRRREELQEEGAEYAANIARLETILYEISQYEKAHMIAVEEQVSSMFKYVTWQLYEPNISNSGEKKKCECLVDGIPYSSNLNTAARINAGIDIINALSKWLGISVPMWIDNKESVCNLIPTESQIITLSVKEKTELSISK